MRRPLIHCHHFGLGFGAGPSIQKTGAGTVELTGVNTYDGETWVTSGTLQFSGNGSANSSTIRLGDNTAANVAVNIATREHNADRLWAIGERRGTK